MCVSVCLCIQVHPDVDKGHGLLYLLDVDGRRRVRSNVATNGKWTMNYDLDLFRARTIQLTCCRVLEQGGAEVVATFGIGINTLKQRAAYSLSKPGEKTVVKPPSSNGVAMQLKLQVQTASRAPARRVVSKSRRRGGGSGTRSSSSRSFGVALREVPATSGGAPMVLVACITELEKRGLHEPELYALSGAVSASRRLRVCAGTPDSIAFIDHVRRSGTHEITNAVSARAHAQRGRARAQEREGGERREKGVP